MDVYHDPRALARVEELLRLPKADLIAQARHPAPHTHTDGALERWRKVELAWAIVRAELGERPREP